MKSKYLYLLFGIVLLLLIIAFVIIDMASVSYITYIKNVTYIKIVAILILFLSIFSMAIITMLYMNYIDKKAGSVDTARVDQLNKNLGDVNKLLGEVKSIFGDFKTKLNDEIAIDQVEDEKRDSIFEELKKLLDEYKGYGKDEIERLQNDVKTKDAENNTLTTNNDTLTEEKAVLEQRITALEETVAEEGKLSECLLKDNELLLAEKHTLEQGKEEQACIIQEKDAENNTLTTNNNTLTEEKAALEQRITALEEIVTEGKKLSEDLLRDNELLEKVKCNLEQEKEEQARSIQEKDAANKELAENNQKLAEYARYGLELVKSFKDEDVDPRAYLKKLRSLFSQYEALRYHDKMCEKMEGICDEASRTIPVYNNLLTLRDNMIKQFKEELQIQDLPLSDEMKKYNLGKLINIAMVAFDLMETMEYSINHSENQKLSVEVALGLKDIKTVKCELVDLDPSKTPCWLRALKLTIESTGADFSNSIISGRRL